MDTELSATIAEHVARGATLLDQRVPGWADRIELELLDILSTDQCVAAQATGLSYGLGLAELGLGTGAGHGFVLPDRVKDSLYATYISPGLSDWNGWDEAMGEARVALQSEWERVIQERWTRVTPG